jgi:hypothetical protein
MERRVYPAARALGIEPLLKQRQKGTRERLTSKQEKIELKS